MIISSRSPLRFAAAAAFAVTSLAAPAKQARAEADFRGLPVAWMTATIAMPASAMLRAPQMQAQVPHVEAASFAPVRLAAAAAAPPERVYPEAVIVRALRHGDSAFDRCWSRARRHDIVAPRKARLHLEVDGAGVVRAAHTEEDDDASSSLPECLSRVGRGLPFPATGKPMKLSLLLLR